MITALLVALIGSAGVVVAALVNNGRHVKEIRRQLTPTGDDEDKTTAEVLADFNRSLYSLTLLFGLHERDDLRHRGSAPERNRRVD